MAINLAIKVLNRWENILDDHKNKNKNHRAGKSNFLTPFKVSWLANKNLFRESKPESYYVSVFSVYFIGLLYRSLKTTFDQIRKTYLRRRILFEGNHYCVLGNGGASWWPTFLKAPFYINPMFGKEFFNRLFFGGRWKTSQRCHSFLGCW